MENLGWKCPYCNKVYSPLVKECLCCTITNVAINSDTKITIDDTVAMNPVTTYFSEGYPAQPMNKI